MANNENLKPFTKNNSERTKRMASKAGKRSGEVRRAKKAFKELAQVMLDTVPDQKSIASVKKLFPQLDEGEINAKVLLLAKQYEKAVKQGDTRAFEALRDTAGEKPIDKTEVKSDGVNFNVFSDAMKEITTKELQDYVKKLEKKTKKK